MGASSERNQVLPPATFSELAQLVTCLVGDIEDAKIFSNSQIELMRSQERDKLKDEKDELCFQVSLLQNELEELRQEVMAKSAELEMMMSEALQARKEAKSTLLQLHQVQEELEYYFLLSRKQSVVLDASSKLHSRGAALLLKAIN